MVNKYLNQPFVDAQAGYGAKFDGTTDDTTAIQNALNAAGGKILFLGSGTAMINTNLLVDPANQPMAILGAGGGTWVVNSVGNTILKASTTFTGAMLQSKTPSTILRGLTIQGVKFDCNSNAQYGLDISGMDRPTLRDVAVVKATSHGFLGVATVNAGGSPEMWGVAAVSNTGDGFHFTDYFGMFAYQLTSSSNTGAGYFSNAGDQWLIGPNIQGNTGAGNLAGVHLRGGNHLQIVGGSVNNNGATNSWTQVQVDTAGANVQISNCWIFHDTANAVANVPLISLQNASVVTLRGNRLEWPTNSTSKWGIQVGAGSAGGGASYVTIIGNTFKIVNGTGIIFNDNAGGNTLTGNVIGPNIYNVTTPISVSNVTSAANLPLIIGNAGGLTGTSAVAGRGSLVTTATDGFFNLPSMAGTPTGVPTAITGYAPILWDDTNKKLWVYSFGAAAWKGIVLT